MYLASSPAPPSRNGFVQNAAPAPSSSDWVVFFAVCILTHRHPLSSRADAPDTRLQQFPVSPRSTWLQTPKTRSFTEKVNSLPLTATPTQARSLGAATEFGDLKQSQIAGSVADIGRKILGSPQIAIDPRDSQQPQGPPSVRFKSTIEEIAPDNVTASTSRPLADGLPLGNPGQVTSEEIRELSNRLRACPLQERRMNIFSYEPVSLPASRVRIFLLALLSGLPSAVTLLGPVAFVCLG